MTWTYSSYEYSESYREQYAELFQEGVEEYWQQEYTEYLYAYYYNFIVYDEKIPDHWTELDIIDGKQAALDHYHDIMIPGIDEEYDRVQRLLSCSKVKPYTKECLINRIMYIPPGMELTEETRPVAVAYWLCDGVRNRRCDNFVNMLVDRHNSSRCSSSREWEAGRAVCDQMRYILDRLSRQ